MDSTWRAILIKLLDRAGIDYFNPIVAIWNEEAKLNEIKQRETCDFCLYVITPKMSGLYSVAEVIDDSNKRPDKTIMVVLTTDAESRFTPEQASSLDSVVKMVAANGAKIFYSLEVVSAYLKRGMQCSVCEGPSVPGNRWYCLSCYTQLLEKTTQLERKVQNAKDSLSRSDIGGALEVCNHTLAVLNKEDKPLSVPGEGVEADEQRTDEVIVRLTNGCTIHSGSSTRKAGDYVRICDEAGKVLYHCNSAEWQENPVWAMRAILTVANRAG